MKNNATITFLSEQQYETESDSAKLQAEGTLEKINDTFIIQYTEPDEEMGKSTSRIEVISTTLVILKRTGLYTADFIIEEGRTHSSLYKTPFGEMSMDITAKKVDAQMTEKGGKIYLEYKIESNSQLIGENTLNMEIKIN